MAAARNARGERPHQESAQPEGRWVRVRRWVFLGWAWAWAVGLAALFTTVTALTLVVWTIAPDTAATTPVMDLAFAGLGGAIAAGVASQTTRARPRLGLAQALVASLALLLAGGLGNRIEPFVGGALFVLVTAVLWALRPPSPRSGPGHLDRPLAVVGLAGLAAAVPVAVVAVRLALAAGPSCFFGQCARGDRFAEFAAAVITFPLLALLGATRRAGWRIPLRTAALGAVVVGVAAVALPNAPGSPGIPAGLFAVAWGPVLCALSLRSRPRGEEPRTVSSSRSEGA